MVKAIVVHEYGGPEVMQWEDVTLGDPGPGEARVRHAAIGVNFVDVYNRTGLYKTALPFTPGGKELSSPLRP
jgi:NADPH2:quinone reductase